MRVLMRKLSARTYRRFEKVFCVIYIIFENECKAQEKCQPVPSEYSGGAEFAYCDSNAKIYRNIMQNPESFFHWQSQSTTAENSPTGQRYIHHKERGSKVLLFVREFKADRVTGGAEAYTYLGTANYVKHEGSRPMNITWRLDRLIPAKFLKKTNKLVVG